MNITIPQRLTVAKHLNESLQCDVGVLIRLLPKPLLEMAHNRIHLQYLKETKENETILIAMERAGLAAPSRCRSGVCGFCHSRLIKGTYKMVADFRRIADKEFNFIHPCCSYPTSDLEIDVPPIDELKEI